MRDAKENPMRRKGKVLKVRLGYNANSSALASAVSALLCGSAGAVTILSMTAAALFSRRPKRERAKQA
jgi:hypothetical protein